MTQTRTTLPPATAPPARAPQPVPAPESAMTSLSALQTRLAGGSALPASTRTRMEAGFGHSFADVRIHTGGEAASATTTARAEAFASGSSIAFAPGRFAPGTSSGDRLIAHELAHVVQQRQAGSGGTVQAKLRVSSPGDSAETSADRAAETVLAGGRAQVPQGGTSLRGRIMRRAMAGTAPAPSRALTLAPAPGTAAPGAGPQLTPMMTASVSAAGGKISGVTRPVGEGTTEASSKTPDEAQTAKGETPAEAKSPAGVMVAGAPAGGEAIEVKPEAAKEKTDKADTAGGKEKEKQAGQENTGGGGGAAGGGGGGGGGGTFGKNLGDRGEAAAQAARQRLDQKADALATNEGADARITAASAAAAPAGNAAEADGQHQQTATLAGAEVPAPDSAGASTRAKEALAGVAPSTIEDLDDFAGPAGAGARAALGQSIAAEADAQALPVKQSLAAVSTPPPGTEPPAALPLPAPLAAPGTADPALAAAVPPPVPDASLDATEFKDSADDALATHDVDDATLAKADEGPLRAIGDDKDDLNAKVDAAADTARGQEASARETAAGELANAEGQSVGTMGGTREARQAGVTAEQTATQTGKETGTQSLADQINGLYTAAESKVTEKLSSLQENAVGKFRTAQGARLEAFSSGVRADLDAFKDERYSGLRGPFRRARDWLLSINSLPEVKALYERHKAQYITDIDALLATIKTDIETIISDCKQTLTDARTAIDTLVASSGAQMDGAAKAALENARKQFTLMETRIESTRKSALGALDRERDRAIAEMNAALETIRAENAGLVDKIAAAIAAIAALLGEFMALLARVTRMGIGNFLSAAASQAAEGVRSHLWDQLQEAFKEWIFMKLPALQIMLNMPPNWLEMLTVLATSMIGLFTENLPAMLPAIGAAAMIWLATTLAAKLIPGVGAIMAVIDGIRAAWGLVQSLFSAASAFFQFVMQVAAPGNGAVAFAKALAHGIVAAVDAILTFLGIDKLIKRVIGAIAKPFGKVIDKIKARFKSFLDNRRKRADAKPGGKKSKADRDDGPDAHARKSARDKADRDHADDDRQKASKDKGKDNKDKKKESDADRKRREQAEEERRNREKLDKAKRELPAKIVPLLRRGTSGLILRARLAVWRLQYRLSALSVENSGRGFRIEARVNPGTEVIQGITFERDDLLIEIRKIAQQVKRDPRVQSATSEIMRANRSTQTPAQARSGNRTQVKTVGERTNLMGVLNVYDRSRKRGFGTVEQIRIGQQGEFRRKQGVGVEKRTKDNQFVSGISGRVLDYDEAQTVVGGRPRHFAEGLRRIAQRTGEDVPGVDMAAAVEHTGIRLQEAQRSPAMLAHMPFEQALLAKGQTDDAIKNHPAYGEGSAERMRAVDRNLATRAGLDPDNPDWSQARQPTGGIEARGSTAAQIEREVNFIRMAIEAQNLHFADRAQALIEIRRIIFEYFAMGTKSLNGPIALPGPGATGDGS